MEISKTSEPVILEQIAVYDVRLRAQEWRAELVEAVEFGIATVSATSTFLDPKNDNTEKTWQERETRKLKSKKMSKTRASRPISSHRLSMASIAATMKKPSRLVKA